MVVPLAVVGPTSAAACPPASRAKSRVVHAPPIALMLLVEKAVTCFVAPSSANTTLAVAPAPTMVGDPTAVPRAPVQYLSTFAGVLSTSTCSANNVEEPAT